MITVFIKELKFKAVIGILDFERTNKQNVVVSAYMCACTDEFIDYGIACKLIKKTIKDGKFKTVEEALNVCAKRLKMTFSHLNSLSLEISKPNIIKNATVGARIDIEF